MPTLDYLTNVIGQRLTGSPNARRANEWSRGKLEGWGLTSARLESWGPFGRGWMLKRFSIQVIKPQTIPLIACPKAWTPGFDKPLEAAVVWLDAKTDADLKKYEGKLKGTIVLADPLRPLNPHFDAPGVRMTEADLLTYANSTGRRFGQPLHRRRARRARSFRWRRSPQLTQQRRIQRRRAAAIRMQHAARPATTRAPRPPMELPAAATRAFRRAMTPLSAAASAIRSPERRSRCARRKGLRSCSLPARWETAELSSSLRHQCREARVGFVAGQSRGRKTLLPCRLRSASRLKTITGSSA